jgi:hypothetical protein
MMKRDDVPLGQTLVLVTHLPVSLSPAQTSSKPASRTDSLAGGLIPGRILTGKGRLGLVRMVDFRLLREKNIKPHLHMPRGDYLRSWMALVDIQSLLEGECVDKTKGICRSELKVG